MKKIFSITFSKNKKHKIITFLGITIKLRNDNGIIKEILSFVSSQTVLILEANDCHYEVIPSYVKYFQDAGYHVHLVVTEKAPVEYFRQALPDAAVFNINSRVMKKLLCSPKLKLYKYLLFTSSVKYLNNISPNSSKLPLITEYYPKIAFDRNKMIFVQHHMERDNISKYQIALADLENNISQRFYTINPHYYGKVKVTAKSKEITKFIVVGNIASNRKNFDLLLHSVRRLIKSDAKFKIIVVGKGNDLRPDSETSAYFDIRGELSFPEMFQEMEEADFFLCLLDPENEEHLRYATSGTSGSFQLIYGFAKPCLLHSFFANVYKFSEQTALLYEKNSDLTSCMKKAVEMNLEDYSRMQKSLQAKISQIEEDSLSNFKKLLNDLEVQEKE